MFPVQSFSRRKAATHANHKEARRTVFSSALPWLQRFAPSWMMVIHQVTAAKLWFA